MKDAGPRHKKEGICTDKDVGTGTFCRFRILIESFLLAGIRIYRERMRDMENRIAEHPILGVPEKGRKVTFTYNDRQVEGYEGEPIAAALKAAGLMVHRYTKKEHKPRGIFCAIGRCTDCVMVVDGKPNIRTCVTPLKEGMKVQTQYGVSGKPFEEQ